MTQLKIYWPRPTASYNYTFEGDGSWIGTRTISLYETAYQNGSQYGNLTGVVEAKWSGSAWLDYRAVRTWYYPYTQNGKYLVGLPAAVNRYKCEDAACDYADSDLTASQWNLYDGQSGYWISPSSGRLTGQRTMTCFADASKVCYANYQANPSYALFSDRQFEYDTTGAIRSR